MARCRNKEKLFLSTIVGKGRGPVAYQKALASYNRKARRAGKRDSVNGKNARKWVKKVECDGAGCERMGTMVFYSLKSRPHFEVKYRPTRVTLTGEAGALGIVPCKPIIEG